MGMIGTVHDDNGTDGAATEAGHGFQRELPVLGRLARLDLQPSLKLIQDPRTSPDVAGRTLADRADMFSTGGQAEGPVEGGHRDHIRERDTERSGDESQAVLREIPILGLDLLENGDQVFLLALVLIDE